jgi:GcrA cell cycle regulator
MEWNEETIARLRALWAEGHSTAEIGRRMGVSKNAVVGKAHRLNLPARPSPIRRDRSGVSARPATARRVIGPTLPPLSGGAIGEAQPAISAPLPAPVRAAAPVADSPPAETRAVAPAPVRALAAPRVGRLTACCWPIGEPGTKSFRFCDQEALTGKPYCGEHAQLAYVKVRDRREEAA